MNRIYNLRNKISTLAPNSVASNTSTHTTDLKEEVNVFEDCLEGTATFSTEQLQQILAAMGGNIRGRSFTQRTARFRRQRDPADVEEFL